MLGLKKNKKGYYLKTRFSKKTTSKYYGVNRKTTQTGKTRWFAQVIPYRGSPRSKLLLTEAEAAEWATKQVDEIGTKNMFSPNGSNNSGRAEGTETERTRRDIANFKEAGIAGCRAGDWRVVSFCESCGHDCNYIRSRCPKCSKPMVLERLLKQEAAAYYQARQMD